jgi:adenylylsulfate kinase
MIMEKVPVLVIIGPVGVGKTSVADAISEILSERSVHHAVIDLDSLRYAFPRPSDDWFHTKLGYKNLARVWQNYKEIGVRCVVIPNVLEERSDIKYIEEAIPGAQVTVTRLKAPVATIHERLRGREKSEKSLAWHLNRAEELSHHLESKQVEDFIVDTENKSIEDIAKEVLEKSNWPFHN